MADAAAALLQQRALLGGEMDAVGQYGLGRQEAVGVVDVRVGVVGGVEATDEGDFVCVFAQVGLDGEVGFFSEGAEAGEQRGGA